MNSEIEPEGGEAEGLVERTTLCLPDFVKESTSNSGDEGFKDIQQKYFPTSENNATERLVKLKAKLRKASTYDFWALLMEDMCDIMGAQCGFVSKRILVDDENTAVEMPPLGEPGSCLLGVAFYLDNGSDVKAMHRDYRYQAYGSPCAHMRHEKVFIIPEKMQQFIPNNPNIFPWATSEAFIGIPLFHEGKSFAHFGMIWSSDGAPRRQLSWSFIEMFMHSLEDMILQRILEGRGFAKEPAAPQAGPTRIIPLDAITASQSLKPYARSLSHELRTPMQGVVGMLDIMHSTVVEALETQTTRASRLIFGELKSNIELVQESSKRAVEAADNVVHAYDLNMQMPETPLVTDDDTGSDESLVTPGFRDSQRPDIVIEGSGISLSPTGRKRLRSEELDFHPGPPLKRLTARSDGELHGSYPKSIPRSGAVAAAAAVAEVMSRDFGADGARGRHTVASTIEAHSRTSSEYRKTPPSSPTLSQGNRHIVIRDFMPSLIDDTLRNVHPVYKDSTQTELGYLIRVRTEGPRGQTENLTIHLVTEPDVPETINAEEQHLQFALQKVVDNAIKFTDNGTIRITVRLSRSGQIVEFFISDTGCGITEESKLHLFKPHFQEDGSISRAKDGLGLSLFNAKAHARKKLGGDITLERSAREGPLKGSDFLIRIPITASLDGSRMDTPRLGTPVPASQPRSRQGSPQLSTIGSTPSLPPAPTSVPTPRRRNATTISSPFLSKTPKRHGFNKNLAKDFPLTFLIAEDNVINRQLLVGFLKKLGYMTENIIQAFDGAEAVQQYEESLSRPDKRIDAVLMDLWMPNMDGYEATEKILKLARERGESLAVMAVTADITSDSLERAKETGMQGFISKPYKVLDIEHLILEHFRKEKYGV